MISLKTCKLMDQEDPLKHFRKNFFNQKDEIYLDGNSDKNRKIDRNQNINFSYIVVLKLILMRYF
ncbi:MAG: hypothetical protein CMC25_06380, partial [Flavobacteriaceae bacterium]|nr:hypothetical protein [Flavobacteriaceae bacterium]